MYDFLLVINSNFVFPTVFKLEKCLFSLPLLCLMPPSGGMPYNINIIYTSLKSTFSVLQFCRRHYATIFIRVADVASQNREIM